MTERRKFLRFETALNAFCEGMRDKWKASCRVKNISKEGALIVSDKEVAEGEELNLSVDVPGDNVPIFASCEVAWQKKPHGDKLYDTGLRFKNINNLDKSRLLEFIYVQWLRLLDSK